MALGLGGCGRGLFDERALAAAADGGADGASRSDGPPVDGSSPGRDGPAEGVAASEAPPGDAPSVVAPGPADAGTSDVPADRAAAPDAPAEQCSTLTRGGNTLAPIAFEELTVRVWLRSLAAGAPTRICVSREPAQQSAVTAPWVYVIAIEGAAVPNEPLPAELAFRPPASPARPFGAYGLAYRLYEGFYIWYLVTPGRADEGAGKLSGEIIMKAFERDAKSPTPRFVAHVAPVVSCVAGDMVCPRTCTAGACQ
jgi:hypothetical protein